MTCRRQVSPADPVKKSWLSFLNGLWPWVLLTVAAVVFVVSFTPKYMVSTMYTETIVLPLFYQDVMVAHHPAANWAWGGFSALFPDVLLYFGIASLVPGGMLSLEILNISFFLAWLAATVALVLELQRPNKLGLLSILLLLWIGLVSDFGFPRDHGLVIDRSLLMPIYHSGTGIMTAICLVFLLRQISRGWGIGFWWLLVLTFLGSASDTLFDAVFVGPALMTLVLLALAFRAEWKWHLTLAGCLAFAAAIAYVVAPDIFPPTLATNYYLQFSWDRLQNGFSSVILEIFRPQHHLYAFVFALDILTVLGGLGGLLFFSFSSRRTSISIVFFSLMIFCSCSILANFTAVMATDDYHDFNANRYTTVALFIPLFILVFALHAIILWRPWLEKIFAVAVSAFALVVGFIPQDHSMEYDGVSSDIPFLKQVMADNDIHACLGCYWSANIATFLSNGEVPVRSLTNGAEIYSWFNSLEWFGQGHPPQDWPRFRLIYGSDPGYAAVFGQPDQVLKTPSGSDVWIYSPAHSICYNEYFKVLSNHFLDDGRTIRIPSGTLPGGPLIEDNRHVAKDGDGDGWLTFGPYIELKPGHYRATYRYSYSVLPAPDRQPTYDMLVHTGDKEMSYDAQPLPGSDTNPQVLSDEFTVTETGHKYEMRIFYHGSGTIRVDSLDLTYLGKE